MSWYSKEKLTPYDDMRLAGLLHLDGDVLPQLRPSELLDLPLAISRAEQTNGKKCPVLQLPSGLMFSLETGVSHNKSVSLRLLDSLTIPISGTRNQTFTAASEIAEQAGYVVKKKGINGLEIVGYDERDHYLLMFDNPRQRLFDIQRVEPEPRPPLGQVQPSPELIVTEVTPPAAAPEPTPVEVVVPVVEPESTLTPISAETAAEIPTPTELTEPPPTTHEERADTLIRKAIYLRLVNLAEKQETPANSAVGLLTHAALTILDALDYGLSRQEIQVAIQIGEYLHEEKLLVKLAVI